LTEGGRPGTPTRIKRLSESVNVTPTRKSRRLSGSAPEEVDNTVVLPLKKRRASIGLAEENIRENETTECPIESTNDTELTTIESNLEVIDEKEEEEITPKKKNKTPVKTPVKTATPSKTPENKSSQKTSASSRQTPKESAKAITEKSPKATIKEPEKAQVKASKTPTKVASPKKTVDSTKVVIEESSGDEYVSAMESISSGVDENDQTIQKDVKKSDVVKEEKKPTPMTEEELLRRLAQSLVKTIPRQKPKSGRFWKAERAQFGSLYKDKGKRIDLQRRLKLKEIKERSRDEANELILAKNKKKEEFRLKIEEARKRKAENARKSEVVQIVKNPHKIKKMKKKDLARRDILGV